MSLEDKKILIGLYRTTINAMSKECQELEAQVRTETHKKELGL